MFLTALMDVTTVPLRNADAAAVEAAGLVWFPLARQAANPGIAADQSARALAPVYWVTWYRDSAISDAVGGEGDISRV